MENFKLAVATHATESELADVRSTYLKELSGGNVSDELVNDILKVFQTIIQLDEATPLQRQFLGSLIDGIAASGTSPSVVVRICNGILDVQRTRMVEYRNFGFEVRIHMFDAYRKIGNVAEAAKTLAKMDYSDDEHVQFATANLRLTDLYLSSDNLTDAEKAINHVTMLQHKLSHEQISEYNRLYGLVLEKQKKFIEAGGRFYERSNDSLLDGAETIQMLKKAIACVIRSPDTPLRQRLLPVIYSDDRCKEIQGYKLLDMIYHNKFIRPTDLAEVEGLIDDEVISQHNIAALSKIFKNITFTRMAELLDTDKDKVEAAIAEMIFKDRLKASIDQGKGVVFFEQEQKVNPIEKNFLAACREANVVYEKIAAQHPKWLERQV